MSGEVISYSDKDLAAIAASYDPSMHEAPIVIGHPKHDDQAYGWVKGIEVQDGKLIARTHQINPEFAELVRKGSYKKVSAAFYRPDTPGNPKPGVYYLRHLGFLGAQPPAVKGLKQVAFASGDDGCVEFADLDIASALTDIAALLRRVRDAMIAEKGLEAANETFPSWQIESVERIAAKQLTAPSYAEIEELPMPDQTIEAEREELDKREADLKEREAAFAEGARKLRRQVNEQFLDGLVKSGRLPKAIKEPFIEFMDTLDASGVVEFGEGDGKVSRTRSDQLCRLLGKLPVMAVREKVSGDGEPDAPSKPKIMLPEGKTSSAASRDLHARAVAYQEKHPDTSYMEAVAAVEG